MIILDGRKARDFYSQKLKEKISRLSVVPTLAIIQVGDNKESSAYIEQKKKFGTNVGIKVDVVHFEETATFEKIQSKIFELNQDKLVHGLIVQLPLPAHLEKTSVINLVDPAKDVDGLTETNRKKLEEGKSDGFVPATALGIFSLLNFYKISVAGKKVAMLGRSMLVGEPTARLLQNHGAKVSVCHSTTLNIRNITCVSDIIVVAIGKPQLVDETYIDENMPVVVDVGINTIAGEKLEEEITGRKIVGDVNFEKVKNIVSAISPVPGGVGPMTVLSLCENVVLAAERVHDRI